MRMISIQPEGKGKDDTCLVELTATELDIIIDVIKFIERGVGLDRKKQRIMIKLAQDIERWKH